MAALSSSFTAIFVGLLAHLISLLQCGFLKEKDRQESAWRAGTTRALARGQEWAIGTTTAQ